MKKVLVVVAHPDDELIWMGGLLIKNKKKWNTHVVCLCRESDVDREPKFRRVCKELGVKGSIFDVDDVDLQPLPLKEYTDILDNFKGTYDIILTHGMNGEYGHVRHKDIHNAVKRMISDKKFKTKEVWFFSYEKKENDYQGYALYSPNATKFIKLNRDELILKKKLIMEYYGYGKGGFEELSCGEVEAFDLE